MFDFFLNQSNQTWLGDVGRCQKHPKSIKNSGSTAYGRCCSCSSPWSTAARGGDLANCWFENVWNRMKMIEQYWTCFKSFWIKPFKPGWEMLGNAKNLGSRAYGRCWSRSYSGPWSAAARGGCLCNSCIFLYILVIYCYILFFYVFLMFFNVI